MKTIIAKILVTVLLATVVAALGTGCVAVVAGAAVGAGSVVYENGNLKSTEYATFDQGWDAANGALRELGYAVVGLDKNETVGKITTRAQGDKKATVEVRKVSGTMVAFEIRYGTWGNKEQSLTILNAIQKRLHAL